MLTAKYLTPPSISLRHTQEQMEVQGKNSEKESLLWTIDNSDPSRKYLCLTMGLDWHRTSLLFQLQSGHIGLNHHFFCICKSETLSCPLHWGITVETVEHFLLWCSALRDCLWCAAQLGRPVFPRFLIPSVKLLLFIPGTFPLNQFC